MAILTTALTLDVGQMLRVHAHIIDAYGEDATSDVSWSTDDSTVAVAKIMNDDHTYAFVSGIAVGTCTITATSGSVTATFSVNVIDPTGVATNTMVLSATNNAGPHGTPQG